MAERAALIEASSVAIISNGGIAHLATINKNPRYVHTKVFQLSANPYARDPNQKLLRERPSIGDHTETITFIGSRPR